MEMLCDHPALPNQIPKPPMQVKGSLNIFSFSMTMNPKVQTMTTANLSSTQVNLHGKGTPVPENRLPEVAEAVPSVQGL